MQYTSDLYRNCLTGVELSYSGKGNPWDNACIESFHSLIKREWLNRFIIRDYDHAYNLVFEYIDAFYNTRRIIVNLAPANTKKEGSYLDLPIAIAILLNIEEIQKQKIENTIFIGELSLDGKINKINGVLPICIEARRLGIEKVIVPFENSNEAAIEYEKAAALLARAQTALDAVNNTETLEIPI